MATEYGTYWTKLTRRRIGRRRLLAVSGSAAFLAACGGGGDGGSGDASKGAAATGDTPKMGGTLKVAIGGEPTNLDPHLGASGGEHAYFFMISDPLIGYDQKGQLDASLSLAESWELADPTRVLLKIRQGVKFSDGAEFSADDVKWNLERILDPANGATPRPDLSSIDSVQAASKTEVVIRLKEPSAPLLTNFGDRGGQMLSRSALERLGKDRFARAAVGTGAMVLKEWLSDANLTFERNPNYWRKDAGGRQLPYLQTIRFDVIPDETVQVAALETGQVDFSGVPATEVKRLKDGKQLQFTEFVGSSTGIWYVNHAFAPLDNVWFRRALSSAMDRKSYINNFLTGVEPEATGLLTPASWGHDASVQNYKYDVAKVKEYLQRSGLPQSSWKVRAQPFGATVTQAEQFWESTVKEAGIPIEWAQPERDGWRTRVLKGFRADGSSGMYFSSWSMRVDPDGNVGQFYTQAGTYNSGLAPTPDTESLVAKAKQTYDLQQRKALYSEIQRKAVDQVYSHVLMHYNVARVFAHKKVGNLEKYYGGEGKPRYANLWV